MLRQRARTLQATMALADAVAAVTAFFAAYYAAGVLLERWLGMRAVLPLSRYIWVLLVSIPMWWLLFGVFGGYDFSPIERPRDSLRRAAKPMAVGALALGAAVFFSKELEFSRRIIGAFLLGNVGLLVAGRLLVLAAAGRLHKGGGRARRILIIGAGDAAKSFAAAIRGAGWGLELAGTIATTPDEEEQDNPHCVGPVDMLPEILDNRSIDDVVIADPARDVVTMQHVVGVCEEVGVCIHIPSTFFEAALSRPHLEEFGGIPMLTFSSVPYNPVLLGVKRTADLVLGTLLLVASAVPMLVFAVIIKRGSPGAAVFRQERIGLYGRPFTLYKFRTMVADAENRRGELDELNEMDGPAFKMRDDPRVTPFGRWLRRHSLDELPQLWNVLTGDMSLIGPRPPLPNEVKKYERWQRRRLSMRPGLACIWQVTDRNLATFEKWMEYDLHYIDNWSLMLDLKIAIQTIPAVLKGTGL